MLIEPIEFISKAEGIGITLNHFKTSVLYLTDDTVRRHLTLTNLCKPYFCLDLDERELLVIHLSEERAIEHKRYHTTEVFKLIKHISN